MNIKQLLAYVIEPTLNRLQPAIVRKPVDSALLLGTALWESESFEYLAQVNGPARGFWMMEPFTERDCWLNFIDGRPALDATMRGILGGQGPNPDALSTNLAYSCAMARVKYARAPDALPETPDPRALATYYKLHYNSSLGAADIDRVTPMFKLAVEATT